MNVYSLDLELSSSQYAYIADNASVSITGDISIEGWFKVEQLPSTAGSVFTIVDKFISSPVAMSYNLQLGTDDKLLFQFSGSGTLENRTIRRSTNAILTAEDVGVWVHLAMTAVVSTRTVVMYKNASSVGVGAVQNAGTSIYDGSQSLAVGASDIGVAASSFFDGKIDDLRIFNDVRTASEILTYYKRELETVDSNLVAYWKFENDYNDSSPNGNNLTSSGSPVFATDVSFDNYPNFMGMSGVGR